MVTLMPRGCRGSACNKVPRLLPSGRTTNVRSSSSGVRSLKMSRTYWVWLTVELQATE